MPVQFVGRRFRLGPAALHSAEVHLRVGLLNNMPDRALERTERQFLTLLDAAAGKTVVELLLYALPDIPRTHAGRLHISRFYSGLEALWNAQLDGLIVTGTEPQCPDLVDEPYWGSLTRVLDWAEDNTHSSVWSCLAAHAAVRKINGIERRPLPEKRFGVFECARTLDHPLTAGLPASLLVPHSRWNDLPVDSLTHCGYDVLTRLQDGGADLFVKQRKSLFVFFQGHPEYESNTLLLEYRRDIGRYLKGERNAYPAMPEGYFNAETAERMMQLRQRALASRAVELLLNFPETPAAHLSNNWCATSTRFYANWLGYLGELRQQRTRKMQHREEDYDTRITSSALAARRNAASRI